jgi:hypothetical protein
MSFDTVPVVGRPGGIGILGSNAMRIEVDETKPGDIDVLYYSGHGSRRLDTLSSKDQMDETIVPIDASAS